MKQQHTTSLTVESNASNNPNFLKQEDKNIISYEEVDQNESADMAEHIELR